ncbi:hypothetical protein PVAP13_8NG267705 [Panicum virgatum]|uniref:Uncharacterized protein n=1 Tax=Panicum virgatum TaxID=38727 RepID=A0A8T0P8G8_PANVG|nr:hypothetical protein PVAP13_8NG267705 [Panicum virgatum]
MENERQHLLYADQRGGGWRTPRSGVAACGGKRYRGWRCCAGTAAGASSRAGGACLPSLDPALARPDPAAVSSAPAPPRRARRGPPRVGSGVREAGSGGGELGACASTSSSARLLAPPPRRGWWAAVAARSGGTPSGGSRRRRRGALEPPRRPTPRSGPRRPLLALPQRGPHQRGRRRPHVGDCALPRSIPDTSSHPPRGAAFHRAPHWRGRPPPPTAFQKRRGRRRRGTMATAQAASASPTHHRVSPGTSPPQPPYPSASRIADSACFPQYTASLKCMRTTLSNRRNPHSGAAVSSSPGSLRTCAFTRELFLCSGMLYGHSLMLSLFLKVWRATRTRASVSSSSTITRSARRKSLATLLKI